MLSLPLAVVAGSHGNAHCSCGELRQASLAPRLWDELIDSLFKGRWFLVFSKLSKYGNDDGPQGTCTPNRTRVPAVELGDISIPDYIADKAKLPGAFARVEKMHTCMELVEAEEASRGSKFATITFSRPDILICEGIDAPAALEPGQMLTWGEDWFGEMNRDMAEPQNILHDYIFMLERESAANLVGQLRDDIATGPQQSGWAANLTAACPAHHDIVVTGDATLECLLANRLRLNGWKAQTAHADFTLLRTGNDEIETRCGSDSCKARAGQYTASSECMTPALYDVYGHVSRKGSSTRWASPRGETRGRSLWWYRRGLRLSRQLLRWYKIRVFSRQRFSDSQHTSPSARYGELLRSRVLWWYI